MSAAVRPWTVSAAAPAPSTTCAMSIALIWSRVQPRRILAVTGVGRTGRHDPLDDRAHPVRLAEQIRTAVGLLRHVADRAAEVDVDDADLVLVGQPLADLGQRLRIVVPHLHRQRPRLVGHAPQPIRMLGLVLVEPDEALGADHLGRQQPRPAKLADDLPKGVVREARHRGLQNRRIDFERPDPERSDVRQRRGIDLATWREAVSRRNRVAASGPMPTIMAAMSLRVSLRGHQQRMLAARLRAASLRPTPVAPTRRAASCFERYGGALDRLPALGKCLVGVVGRQLAIADSAAGRASPAASPYSPRLRA